MFVNRHSADIGIHEVAANFSQYVFSAGCLNIQSPVAKCEIKGVKTYTAVF